MFVGERGTQFKIKLLVFKKKECSYLYNNFVSDIPNIALDIPKHIIFK